LAKGVRSGVDRETCRWKTGGQGTLCGSGEQSIISLSIPGDEDMTGGVRAFSVGQYQLLDLVVRNEANLRPLLVSKRPGPVVKRARRGVGS